MIKANTNKPMFITVVMMTAGLLSGGTPSHAQGQQDLAALEEVLVTGSRVAGRTATEAPVPVDVISGDDLARSGFTELGQALQTSAPSFNFSRTQISDGSDLYRPATLRGMQPDQTLVLINSKRRHTQAIFALSGTVGEGAAGTDMNAIPLIALQSVEVLRDGAAAQYGSDAIAGVINLKLKETTDVTTGYIQWGETTEGDGDAVNFGINSGFELGTQGGFINLSLEYRDADRTNRAERDTGGPDPVSSDVRWHQGDPETEFTSFFFNAMLPVGAGQLYSFGGYSNRTALGSGFYRDFNRVERNVPQVYPNGFLPNIDNEADDYSTAIGYRQDLFDEWKIDVSGIYGKNGYEFTSRNTINSSIAAQYLAENPAASDADIAANAGPTSGFSGGFDFEQITFNVDISGSIDWNNEPFYIAFGAEYRQEDYEIIAGSLASYSCGRDDGDILYPSVIDGVTPADCGFQAYPGLRPEAAGSSDRDSYALYVDVERNITENWLTGLAVRFEDFDTAGSETVGKLATRYEFNENLAVRAAVATGFRAPSLQQVGYTAFTTSIGENGLTQSFTASAGSAFPAALGVKQLEIETSESVSAGVVWNLFDNVTVTLDAYSIKVDDRITLGGFLGADDLVGNQAALDALAASGVEQANFFSNAIDTTTRGVDLIVTYDTELAGGDLSVVFAGNHNNTTVDDINAPTGVPEAIAFSPISESFITDGQPQNRATLTFDWNLNPFRSVLRLNYFGETEVDYFAGNHIPVPNTLPTSVVESAVLVDLDLSYTVNDYLVFTLGANNIFDETPDELDNNEVLDIITNGAMRYPLRAVPFGFNGASYYLKMNFNF